MSKFGEKYANACEDMASFTIPGKVRVDIGWVGEGLSGDYKEEDPKDYPHLRFDAYDLTKHEDTTTCTGGWDCCRGAQDASYCTRLPAHLPKDVLKSVCRHIAERIEGEARWKRILEELSWLDEKDAVSIHSQYQKTK